jgi:hypothetical protein
MRLNKIAESRPPRAQDAWDLFGDTPPRPKLVETQPPTIIPYKLDLYRGFDADMGEIDQRDGQYVLSPRKSEQGLIWFTHKLISGYDPIEYVTGRGAFLLTYPLECVRHIERKIYDDGSHHDFIPEAILDATDPTSNSQFYLGVELPDGWIFSYKMEKFIGCNTELLVTPDMITKQG